MTSLEKAGIWTLLAVHLLGWTIVPWLTNTALPLDVIEAIYWGHEWAWGYDKHPPLSAWTAEAFAVAFGDLGPYLLSQVCLVSAACGIWLIGGEMKLRTSQRVAGLLLMETVLYYNYTSPEFNVNIIQLPFWAFGWLFGIRAATSGKYAEWIGLGVCVGLAALGKYLGVFMLVPLFLAYFQRGELKRVLTSPGIYLAGVVSILVFLPHLLWMKDHDWITVTYGLKRTSDHKEAAFFTRHIWYPLEYLLGQIATLAPLLLIALWSGKRARIHDKLGLTGLAWGGLALMTLLSFLAGWKPVTMWSGPFCLGIGLWAAAQFAPVQNMKRVMIGAMAFGVLALIAQIVVNGYGPVMGGKPHKVNYDGPGIAAAAEKAWSEKTNAPFKFVIGDRYTAGLVSWYGKSRPSVMVVGDETLSSTATNAAVRENGGLVIWQKSHDANAGRQIGIERAIPAAVAAFPEMEIMDDLVIPHPRRKDGMAGRFGMGLVHPPK